MSNIEELAAASLAAMDAERKQKWVVHRLEETRRGFVQDAVTAARDAAIAEAEAQFRIGITEAEAEHRRLLDIADQAAIAHGASQLAGMHQGVWCHWSRPNRFGFGPELVTERGILEVWTRLSASPNNQAHGLPAVGDVAMRLLKKDGQPSSRVARDFWIGWGGERTPAKDWRPEEQQP